MLNVIMLNVDMMSVIMLSGIMLSVIMLSVITLHVEMFNVVAPYLQNKARLKVLERGKHSSLFNRRIDDKLKLFFGLTPVANVIKLFTAVRYDFS
jgi:hypothetical protein